MIYFAHKITTSNFHWIKQTFYAQWFFFKEMYPQHVSSFFSI